MSKKRTREPPAVDVSLIEVYEDLAHEDEDIRLKAAHRLLKEHIPTSDSKQLETIFKRLFRGLCSSRKAARLGFSVALTESLSQIKEQPDLINGSQVIDILESVTVPEGHTSGQDERDHYFGRLFGSEAIIESGLLFNPASAQQWQRLLDIICDISLKKPWLRRECGWILCKCVNRLANNKPKADFILQIINKLIEHKLIRTPEGLAIWIVTQRFDSANQLPRNIWKHDDPLTKNNLHVLSQVLRDAKGSAKDDTDFDMQGSAMWSGQLHFAWDMVTTELFQNTQQHDRITFAQFWQIAVEDALFARSSSQERKHWGLLLLRKMIMTAPKDVVSVCFTKNAIASVISCLRADDRYLKKDAQQILNAFESRCKQEGGVSSKLIPTLIKATGMIDFDTVMKTKTLESVFSSLDDQSALEIAVSLAQLADECKTGASPQEKTKFRNLINIQSKLVSQTVHRSTLKGDLPDTRHLRKTIDSWMEFLRESSQDVSISVEAPDPNRTIIQEKLAFAFEQLLKLQEPGRLLLLDCVMCLRDWKLAADEEIASILAAGWKRFELHRQQILSRPSSSSNEGLALLYGLVIFQIHIGETEAVSILEDLVLFEENPEAGMGSQSSALANADGLVEILLSFASKPSKFLRRITLIIFDSFTSQTTRNGLAPFINVLQTKESKAGQEELFEVNGSIDGDEDGGEGAEGDSDVEMLDSDVEVVDVDEKESLHTASPDPESDSEVDLRSSTGPRPNGASQHDSASSEAANTDDDDEADLIALETSLAQALGTRKLTSADLENSPSDSESDSDMDDDEMMSLDAKLSEVFRTRAAAQSLSKTKQKENKAGKENMTNFKNRVLDMVEIYFKNEAQNGNVFELMVPILFLVRSTAVKQLADRGVRLIATLSNLCKGSQSAPSLVLASSTTSADDISPVINGEELASINDIEWALTLLSQIHEEVNLPSSRAHKAACSQSSILTAKAILKAGGKIETVLSIYSQTQIRMLMNEAATVPVSFFADWIGFCHTIRGKLGSLGFASKDLSFDQQMQDVTTAKRVSGKQKKSSGKKKNNSAQAATEAASAVNGNHESNNTNNRAEATQNGKSKKVKKRKKAKLRAKN